MTNENGVSKIVGAILLVALVIVAMMIVAVALLSQPPPQEIPQVNALAGNNTSHIFIQNNGGDSLTPFETIIRIDGNPDPVPPEDITLIDENGNYINPWTTGDWSVGSTLEIKDNQPPKSVSLIYSGGSSQALIFTATFIPTSGAPTPTPTSSSTTTATTTGTTTATTSPTPTPTPDCGTISGYKWNDLNGNGIKDMGEPGMSGWTINVSECNTGNCNSLTPRGSQSTDSSGYYLFTGLTYQPATKYIVQEILQSGWQQTFPSSGYHEEQLNPPGSPGQPEKCYEIKVNFGNKWAPDFSGSPRNGPAPLTVDFTDLSIGSSSWLWNFGDGGTSIDKNPTHTYLNPGSYTVTLTVSNAWQTVNIQKVNYIDVEEETFDTFIIDNNVFIYGNSLKLNGDITSGPGATIIILGGLNTVDLNGGASVASTTVYIGGNTYLDGGSASLGSAINPGNIYIDGDLTLKSGSRDVYGDVYVNGDFFLKDAKIHNNVYVNGDLTLDWTPTLDSTTRIYYTGQISYPQGNYPQTILNKCIHQTTVPGFTMPDEPLPPVKSVDWYSSRGYVSGGSLTNNLKIFADSYSSTTFRPSAYNVIIIARNGNIRLTGLGSSGVTGVLYAPYGSVTFEGGFFEGTVITRDGFYVTSGGTSITFKNFSEFFGSSADYPF